MNERLKELYQQAHSIRRYDGDPALDGNPPTVYWQGEVSAQRFAELIVRECLEQIYSMTIDDPMEDWDQGYDSGLDQAAETIKTHFGVEE